MLVPACRSSPRRRDPRSSTCPGRLFLQPVERLSDPALPGDGAASPELGGGEVATGGGELLLGPAHGIFLLLLGAGRGADGLVSGCLFALSRSDGLAALFPL